MMMATIPERFKGTEIEELPIAVRVIEADFTDKALIGSHFRTRLRCYRESSELLL